jgi:hypothetical protein
MMFLNPPIVDANIMNTPTIMEIQLTNQVTLNLLGFLMISHIILGRKKEVGAKPNPPKKPRRSPKKGKLTPMNNVNAENFQSQILNL